MRQTTASLLLAFFFLCQAGQAAGEEVGSPIGRFVIAKGNVLVMHRNASLETTAKVKDPAFFLDRISTQGKSRAKILFLHDMILTLAPSSTVEITKAVYNPEKDQHETAISLVKGTLKALVRPSVGGSPSRVEVHTPTAVAAVRGTRFIAAVDETGTHILNISDSEHSEVEIKKAAIPGEGMAADYVVRLDPGKYGFVPGGTGEVVIGPIPPSLLAGYEEALGSSGEAEDAILEPLSAEIEKAAVFPSAEKQVSAHPNDNFYDDKPLLELIPYLIPDQQPSQPAGSNITIKVQIP